MEPAAAEVDREARGLRSQIAELGLSKILIEGRIHRDTGLRPCGPTRRRDAAA
jgi:hypothetical protein